MRTLVFSRDRALQLDATLRSLLRHAAEPELIEVMVLHKGSSERYAAQYEELRREYLDRVKFVREIDFRSQVLALIGGPPPRRYWWKVQVPSGWAHRSHEPAGSGAGTTEHVFFIVDDTLFVHRFSLAQAVNALEANGRALGFSFRLGRNTTNSYVLSRAQVFPAFVPVAQDVLKFDWTHADGDFAYPLELSSSMYRTETVAALLRGMPFSDPNTLESQMSLNAGRLRRRFPFLLCWEASAAFSAPVNRVQEVFQNRSGGAVELSVGSLANLFEAGQRLDLEALDGFVPTACHQEVSLAFKSAAGSTRTGTVT